MPKNIECLTQNAPTTYYYAADGTIAGFDHDLIMAFAKEQNYKVNFIVKKLYQRGHRGFGKR